MQVFPRRLELHGPEIKDGELTRALNPWTSWLPWYRFTRRWRIRALNFMFLRDTRITGASLKCLNRFRNLLWLDLAGVNCLEPVGLITIGASRSLRVLNL